MKMKRVSKELKFASIEDQAAQFVESGGLRSALSKGNLLTQHEINVVVVRALNRKHLSTLRCTMRGDVRKALVHYGCPDQLINFLIYREVMS